MVERYELFGPSQERFGNPAPLGLLGLAIGCAALVPIAFGVSVTPSAFETAALYALLFGAGCQLLCGLMMFANKNSFGGTVFTSFSFLWAMNAWAFHALAQGQIPDHAVGLSVEVVLLVVFLALTWGFGFVAKALFVFLADIDLLFVFRILRSVTHSDAMNLPIALTTVALGAIALWLAFGALLHPIVGRSVFGVGGPLFRAPKRAAFDWTLRRTLFAVLYGEWQRAAFRPLPLADLQQRVDTALGAAGHDLAPDLAYLAELGYLVLATADDPHVIATVRLHAKGVDIHEQLVLGKYALPAGQAH